MRGRRFPKPPDPPARPGWRDYFQMATTAIMVCLGITLLWQTLFIRWAVPSLILGIALLLFSLMRVRFIVLYFRAKARPYGP